MNLSMLAILLGTALAVAGVEGNSQPEEQQEQWFLLQMGGDPSDPNDYTITGGSPSNCVVGDHRCAILAEEDATNPGKPTQDGVDDPAREVFRSQQ
ncbi:hypothetical protein [Pontibacter amylolyticus]|nr:hypothetical protein [Pontibacter amylolyticus]